MTRQAARTPRALALEAGPCGRRAIMGSHECWTIFLCLILSSLLPARARVLAQTSDFEIGRGEAAISPRRALLQQLQVINACMKLVNYSSYSMLEACFLRAGGSACLHVQACIGGPPRQPPDLSCASIPQIHSIYIHYVPVISQEEVRNVYFNGLASGWRSESYGCDCNFDDTEQVRAKSHT